MAVNDQRLKTDVRKGGSSKLAVGLTAAQHIAAIGDPSATGGWVIPSYQQSTTIGPDRDNTQVKDEADILIEERIDRDEFIITTTFFQTNAELLDLLEWMENADNAVPLRYPMPNKETGESQWVLLYNANVRVENWTQEAQNAENRLRQVTFVGTKDSQGRIKAIKDLPDDTTDPAWASYPEFIDTAKP
jgi:hypothetical protein